LYYFRGLDKRVLYFQKKLALYLGRVVLKYQEGNPGKSKLLGFGAVGSTLNGPRAIEK
jgi:hypothetical protein